MTTLALVLAAHSLGGLVVSALVLLLVWAIARYIVGKLNLPPIALTIVDIVAALIVLVLVLDFFGVW